MWARASFEPALGPEPVHAPVPGSQAPPGPSAAPGAVKPAAPSRGASVTNAVLQEIATASWNGISPRSSGNELPIVNPSTVTFAGHATRSSSRTSPVESSPYAVTSLNVEPGATAPVRARFKIGK